MRDASISTRRLPAEWEPQSGVMLVWPHQHSAWKHNLKEVEKTYLAIVAAISTREIVVIVCFDESHRKHIKQLLGSHPDSTSATTDPLQFVIAPSNDTWVRDTGPLSVVEDQAEDQVEDQNDDNRSFSLLDFTFNGWGEKYPSVVDNEITTHLKQAHIFQHHSVLSQSLVLEGGSIESDGQGTILTTNSCLNNPNRNPTLTSEEVEKVLCSQLGINRILWLQHGYLEGDDTDGHIDTLARFCSLDTIAYTSCDDPADIHFEPLSAMAEELSAFKTSEGNPYRLLPLPIPAAIHNPQGERLPANYANFLIINEAVLVPTYNDPNDELALQTLARCFPERKIIGIDCQSLLQQFGSLHCATMQFPHGVLQ